MPSSLDCSWARYWVFYCIPGRPFWGICYIVPSLTCIFDIKWISNLTKTCSNHLSFIFWCCLIFLVSCDPLEGYGQVCDWYVDMFSLPLVIYIYLCFEGYCVNEEPKVYKQYVWEGEADSSSYLPFKKRLILS